VAASASAQYRNARRCVIAARVACLPSVVRASADRAVGAHYLRSAEKQGSLVAAL